MLISFFILLLLLTLVIFYVTRPLFTDDQAVEDESESPTGTETYEDVLGQLRDLDFDFKAGKMSAEDYPVLREALLLKAAQSIPAPKEPGEKSV